MKFTGIALTVALIVAGCSGASETTTSTPSPAATATPASAATLGPAPTFVASTKFDSFSDAVQTAFLTAVNNEFSLAYPKAGISVAVFDGQRLWTTALGIASSTASMTPTTPMIIRSTSKTFVSAMVLTQIEDGLYAITDTVESLLYDHPDYHLIDPQYVNLAVTVEQLLTQTSGIADWSDDLNTQAEIMKQPTWKPADNFSRITTPFIEPGTYDYSYANALILGLIMENRGGKNVNALYQETFFEPLGISGGLLPEVSSPSDLARAHDDLSKYGFGSGFGDMRAGPLAIFLGKDPRISWVGAGIVSTPENIARWGYELFSPSGSAIPQVARIKLIDSLKIDITGLELSGIGVATYGYYAGIAEVALSDGNQLKTYTHPGGGGGRTSWLYYSPSLDVSVSLLANSQLLHDPASCGYRATNYMPIGECIAGGIFSTLSGLPVNRAGGY